MIITRNCIQKLSISTENIPNFKGRRGCKIVFTIVLCPAFHYTNSVCILILQVAHSRLLGFLKSSAFVEEVVRSQIYYNKTLLLEPENATMNYSKGVYFKYQRKTHTKIKVVTTSNLK